MLVNGCKAKKSLTEYRDAIQEHEWISFITDDCIIIRKNEDGKGVLFAKITEYFNIMATTDSIFILNKVSDEFSSYSINGDIGRMLAYQHTNIAEFNIYSNILPRNFTVFNRVKEIDVNGVKYDRFFWKEKSHEGYYGVKFLENGKTELIPRENDTIRGCTTYTYYFFNKSTKLLDSVYVEEYDELHGKSAEGIKARNFSFENRQNFIDSIFNINNPAYNNFSFCNENTPPLFVKTISDIADTSRLDSIFLNQPLVNIHNDTLFFRNAPDQWKLLCFCINGCKPCYKQLYIFNKEQDSLGYRILEHLGIKLYCINPTTNHLDLLKKITDRFNVEDIAYCSKGITRTSGFGSAPEYVLVSPNNEIVYKSQHLSGDYSELLKAKAEYEKQHNLKP